MNWSWSERGIDQLVMARRDVERSTQVQATKPDRPISDPRGLTRPTTLDQVLDTLEGFLDDGEMVQSGRGDLPRVRISTEAWQKGGYKRDVTVEFPALDVLSDDGIAYARAVLTSVDGIVREHIAAMDRRDAEQRQEAPVPT